MWGLPPPSHDWPADDPLTPFVNPDGDDRSRRRAARLLWLTGAILCVVFGSCAAGMWMFDSFTPAEVEQILRKSQTGDVNTFMEQYRQVAPHLRAIAVMLLLLGFLPGLAYLYLGFPVQRGRRSAAVAAFVLTGTQTLVVTLICLLNLLAALMTGNPGGATMTVLIWGSLAGLLAYTAWTLLRVVRSRAAPAGTDPPDGREPWDRW